MTTTNVITIPVLKPTVQVNLTEAMPQSSDGPWKRAVIDALICSHIYRAEHENDPRKALNDLMIYETQLALDPQVSEDAQALVDRGRQAVIRGSSALTLTTGWRPSDETVYLRLTRAECKTIRDQLERSVVVDSGSPLSRLLKVLQEKA